MAAWGAARSPHGAGGREVHARKKSKLGPMWLSEALFISTRWPVPRLQLLEADLPPSIGQRVGEKPSSDQGASQHCHSFP